VLQGAGCTERVGSSERADLPAAEPRPGGSFHLMLEAPGTLDPGFVDDVYEACVANQIYDGLLEFDANLNPVPAIAREWNISRDGRTYVFTLRDDVRFHNGRPVTAEDFVYSFTRIFDPRREDHGLGGEYLRKIEGAADFAGGAERSIRGLVALDAHTLQIRLDEPYPSFLSALAMDQTKVVPREEVERWGADFARHPCGTGPFRFDGLVEDAADPRIRLPANDDYFRGRPWLDEVVFHVPGDYNVDRAAELFLAGGLTLCDIPGAMRQRFEDDPDVVIVRRPELSFSFLGMNVDFEPVTDPRVRRAVACAVDRERLLALDPGGRIAAGGILPPGMLGYAPEPRVAPYDPEEARRLLAEAGHPGGRGLPTLRYWQADRGEIGRLADEALKDDLASVGIDVEFRYIDWDEFDRRLTERTLPAFGLTWVADVPDPDSFLASLFSTTGVYNLFGYSNAEVDSLLAVGSTIRSARDRVGIYRRAEPSCTGTFPPWRTGPASG